MRTKIETEMTSKQASELLLRTLRAGRPAQWTMEVPRSIHYTLACKLQSEFSVRMTCDVDVERSIAVISSADGDEVDEETAREMTQYAWGFLGCMDSIMCGEITTEDMKQYANESHNG